jgi:hypothetical protein
MKDTPYEFGVFKIEIQIPERLVNQLLIYILYGRSLYWDKISSTL